ncbi:metallophosphoesterase [Paenibacillus sp. LHD-117]|uniref:metallophosphoesterase n=1 Tax=Paenibacillus sp. LHD-117 TaxID=3071412 RepID=UPI0027DF7AE0|nr:metallophosphoesterase [Paenibacillus sp. LHD-117]MDQ6422370.1 metallophosphoesterase [Paenibacillus sp. LHD-117]
MLSIVLCAALLFYLAFIWPTQWLKIERVRMPLGIGIRVLQVSDLHVDRLRVTPQRLEAVIRSEKPDYVFLTGDFTYKRSYLPSLDRYLRVIEAAGVPAYAVLGNHDYELPRLRDLTERFRARGIPLLRNSHVELPGFRLVGIDNYSTGHSRIKASFQGINGPEPVVVITHDPNVVLEIDRPFDYLMAGHLHGKQMNIPFFFAFKPKGPLSTQGIYKGLHNGKRGPYYISKGIGQAGVNARFMVRSEVTIHDL